jgi:hypothetical protein
VDDEPRSFRSGNARDVYGELKRPRDTSTLLLEINCYSRCMAEWSFLTKHGRALLCIAHDPGVRLRDIAATVNITERSAYAIVGDLTEAGYVLKEKDGRRNRYIVQHHLPLPETTIRVRTVGEVLELLVGKQPRQRAKSVKRIGRPARTKKRR